MSRVVRPYTIDDLRHAFVYNQQTGVLYWKNPEGLKMKPGDIAGSRHSCGYRQLSFRGNRLFTHRVAWVLMTGELPPDQIDHINCDKMDNRWKNLRVVDQQLNSANMKRRPSNKSGFKGVVENKKGKFLAFIHVDHKTQYLGTFGTPEEAHNVYLQAAQKVWGNHARAA